MDDVADSQADVAVRRGLRRGHATQYRRARSERQSPESFEELSI